MAARVDLFEGLDNVSAFGAIVSQLEDIRQINPGHTTDEDLAFQRLKLELETSLSTIRDRAVAIRMDPTGLITARGMHRAAQLNPPVAQITPSISQRDEDEAPEPESSTWGAARKTKKPRGTKCASCMDDIPPTDVAHLPCKHDYCGDCVLQLFSTSLVDETLFPPRCCQQPIPPVNFIAFLTPELIESYEKKKQERETTDPTYCSDPSCAAFMRPENITGDCATCPDCKKVTCTMCKAPAHEGDCPADEGLQKLLELAKDAGWQRCSSCKAMVSITVGCNHMKCRCNVGWCYLCGKTWKTCRCEQFSERYLLTRMDEIVNHQGPQDGITRAEQLRTARENLQEHCDQGAGFEYSRGAGVCENCSQRMFNFTFDCSNCGTQYCRRCAMNRV